MRSEKFGWTIASVLTIVSFLMIATIPGSAVAQFRELKTDGLRLIYFDLSSDFLVRHVARSFENSLEVYRNRLSYYPTEPVTVYLHDLGDFGNAGADVLPRNRITMAMAPLSYVFETAPANERMNSTLHHELIHVATNDRPAGRESTFRALFRGKVSVENEDPVTILYSYLTAPRRYAPRWYQEGIAVFMETWMSGGLGRSMGGYDEMVFRARVLEGKRFYDMVGLEAEGTSADFQVGVNSYLYGTRFMSYLAYTYSPEQVLEWMNRDPGSKPHFTTQFKHVFGRSITDAWQDWVDSEKTFQKSNLEKIRENPVTPFRTVAARPLGSLSRIFVDRKNNAMIAAANYPGKLSHILEIGLEDGRQKKITDVSGPTLFFVSSVAFNPDDRRFFYTTNNSRWRDLNYVDLETGKRERVMKGDRVGDLAFNRADGSLWGVRHDLGLSTIVRIPPPYTEWNQVYTLPYGQDIYDIDISPDGLWLSGAWSKIDGSQALVRLSTDKTDTDSTAFETLFDFIYSNPEGFVYSVDGNSLYGSSYYSGVSNIYRYDFSDGSMHALSNTDTGFFRPVQMPDDSLLVFRFTADGFQPVMIADEPVDRVSAIDFLGQKVVEEHPVVKEWIAPPPSRIDLDSLGYSDAAYRPASEIGTESIYPVVHGYKDEVAVGLRWNLSDPLGMHRVTVSATYSPSTVLPNDERFHASVDYRYLNWKLSGSYNRSDFYDLFGPTKRSRRGYAASLTYGRTISYEGPKKNLAYELGAAGYFNLQKLPSFQEIDASFTELGKAHASLTYKNFRSSIGAVDNESGAIAGITGSTNFVDNTLYPRVSGHLDLGVLLPVPHLSFWLRTSAGISAGDPANPFANFYFGGFRNNWVDRREEKQFRGQIALPGLEIDHIGGTNYARSQAELILPPIRFRKAGGAMLFLKWLRISLFSTGIVTNIDRTDVRTRAYDAGAQIDLRIMLFSYLKTTLSFGHAVAHEVDGRTRYETMFSVKIL